MASDKRLLEGERAAAISTQMVGLLRQYAGRGPTKARTTIGRDHVLVIFHDTLTTVERTVVNHGASHLIHRAREALQDAMEADATRLVEGLTGRKVVAFMSTNHMEPDMAAELFVLEPEHADAVANGSVPEEAEVSGTDDLAASDRDGTGHP